jgi:cyclic pyranopterin phosphate synthase
LHQISRGRKVKLTHVSERGVKMVEISGKKDVRRIARASGKIVLKRETIERVKEGRVEKGNVLTTAQIAATLAVKRTPELIPMCHPLQITGVDVDFDIGEEEIEAMVEVRTIGKTGVEMEAITGVAVALLTIWDMVKAIEKDEEGQYPFTRITDIRVLEKIKGE